MFGIGSNSSGELGLGDQKSRSEWTKISAFDKIVVRHVQCGDGRSAVLTNLGLFVMGMGLSSGENIIVATPTRIELEGIMTISMRSRFVKFVFT